MVDFNTDSVNAAAASGPLKEDYPLQGSAYTHTIRRAAGKEFKEVVFVFLQPRRDVRAEDLEGAMRDAPEEAEKSLCVSLPGFTDEARAASFCRNSRLADKYRQPDGRDVDND